MEQTTLQQRIEERAKSKLLKDLLKASEDETAIMYMFGSDNYRPQLDVRKQYNSYNHETDIRPNNDYTEQLYKQLLPKYIDVVTDEILQKIDEIDYLVKENQPVEY